MTALILKYPKLMLMKQSDTLSQLDGFITIQGKDYHITVEAPCFPSANNIRTKCDIELQELLSIENLEFEKVEENVSVLEYLNKLVETCEKLISNDLQHFNHISKEGKHEFYELLLSNIEKLGWNKFSHISSDFSSLHLICRDDAEREHKMFITVPSNYPKHNMSVSADLPVEVDFSSKRNLPDVYKVWEEELRALQMFWNILDCLDETALVLDPEKPMRKHSHRRIIMENQVSVHLTFSPTHPEEPPKCQLLGPSSLVAPLNDKVINVYQIWDNSKSVVDNLENILNVSIIKKHFKNSNNVLSSLVDLNVDCSICYAFSFEDELPDFTCDYCKKKFHHSCLYDWLRCLPCSRQNAQYIRGDCPFCTRNIVCVMPS